MAVNFLTVAIDGFDVADLQRANAGDVKKIKNCNDLMISQQTHSSSLHSYVFLIEFPLFDGSYNFLTFAIDGLFNADTLRANEEM